MLRQVRAGRFAEAIAIAKQHLALPATLGRVCHRPCERPCRRKTFDAPVAIGRIERCVADQDLASAVPVPARQGGAHGSARGDRRRRADGPVRRLAPAAAGPRLHAVRRARGGRRELVRRVSRRSLAAGGGGRRGGVDPPLGRRLRTRRSARRRRPLGTTVGRLRRGLVCGRAGPQPRGGPTRSGGRPARHRRQPVSPDQSPARVCRRSSRRRTGRRVHSVAGGRMAAIYLDQFLSGAPLVRQVQPFSSHVKCLRPEEMRQFMAVADPTPRAAPLSSGRGAGGEGG